MKPRMGKRIKYAVRSLMLFGIVLAITGCNNAVGIDNGAISGELKLVGGGPLPAIAVRAEALGNAPAGSPAQFVRMQNVQGMDGRYFITDVPVGVYQMQYYIPEYSQGYLYQITLIGGAPGTGDAGGGDDGGGGHLAAKVSSKRVRPKQAAAQMQALVESGKTYVMPTIYIERVDASGIGVFTGHVYNSKGKNIPVNGASVTVGGNASWSDTTDETGMFTISGITAGESYAVAVTAPGYTPPANPPQISVGMGQTVTQDIFMDPMLATIRGNIVVDGKFADYIDWTTMVHVTVTGKGSGWNDDAVAITNNGWFEVAVPAYLPGYDVTVVALEPLFDESSTVTVPKLMPNQIHRIEDGDLLLHIKHKSVTCKIIPPLGESPIANTYINVTATGAGTGTSVINTVEARASGTGYTCRIDVPYGLISFATQGANSANTVWQDAMATTYDINDYFSQTIYLLLGGGQQQDNN